MEDREENETGICSVCGEPVDLNDTSNFVVSAGTVVCGECAHRHGGVYDAEREEWATRPHLPAHFQRPDYEA
jgi:recombinational DNA repair protein (RecF pathway)